MVFKFRNLKTGQAIAVPQGEFIIGRAEDAYVHLEDTSVSRHHAQLINSDKGYFLEDLGSANGTTLRGVYLTGATKIELGDLVHIGPIPFRIDPEVAGEPTTPPSAGLRSADRAYVRKATERISIKLPTTGAELELPSGTPRDLIRKSVPLPTLARLTASPSAVASAPAEQVVERTYQSQPTFEEPVEDAPAIQSSLAWFVVSFLAGLGIGLILGLVFAKIFLDMGGKAAALP